LILKINTKQICILFLAIFIGQNCVAKKTLKNNKPDNVVSQEKTLPKPDIKNARIETDKLDLNTSHNNEMPQYQTMQDLSSRVEYLEELLNSHQAQSFALDNPRSFFSKKILLTNGSLLYGNIIFQDDVTVKLETLIGTLVIEKNTIIRVVDQAVSVLDKDEQFITLNTQKNLNPKTENIQNQHSAKIILLGDFTEQKDENQNTILIGQVKNVGLQRADFAKITFTIYRNQSYDSMPVEYTAFINGSSVSFDENAISTSSLYSTEVGDFSLVIPSDFGPFVSYTYRIDWEEYE